MGRVISNQHRNRLGALRRRGVWAACASLVLSAGCAYQPPPERPPEPQPPGIEAPSPPPEREPEAGPPAAVAELVARAQAASAAGQHDSAAADLERALRIEPRSAVLWQNLAVVRYRQNRYSEAENLAERSNALAGGDRALQRRNWSLIAAVRAQQGDRAGAEEAAARAAAAGAN